MRASPPGALPDGTTRPSAQAPRTGEAPFPRFSVCIPTFERSHLLAKAIDSALAQDYPHLEVVIGDNGSSDATEPLCRRYAADPRVRYFRSAANVGAANNIRALVRHHAGGDYVLVLCDDDALRDPAYFSKAADLIRAHRDEQVMLLFANTVTWSDELQRAVQATDFKVPPFVRGTELFERWWTSFGGAPVYVPLLTAIFHRQTAADLFVFDQDVMAGDTMLWWKLLLVGNAAFVDTQAAVYRIHGGNDSSTASLLRHIPNLRMFVEPARLAAEAGFGLPWLRAWKYRMASAFLGTIGSSEVKKAFVESNVHNDLKALYLRAFEQGIPADAERAEEDRILERARAFLTERAHATGSAAMQPTGEARPEAGAAPGRG